MAPKGKEVPKIGNPLGFISPAIRQLPNLEILDFESCELTAVPDWLGELSKLKHINLANNRIEYLPASLGELEDLESLDLHGNPLNPELAAAYREGLGAVKTYLRAKAEEQIVLNEAKLILVGEGEVGKTSLLGALRGEAWIENRLTTHGVEIKEVQVLSPNGDTEIVLNAWDFGGQPIYRPTHQMFFSAPAVYLAVWKPREGLQQDSLEQWLTLIQYRAPEAKVLVVATHGGPGQRQPDIDRQEIRDRFGKEAIVDFLHVDSKPDPQTKKPIRIDELKEAIARVAAYLPEMGRLVPAKWQRAREALQASDRAYISYQEAIDLCRQHGLAESQPELFLKISHTLGHLIHYDYDPILRDIVILKPDWLAKAISFILDDKETRENSKGLVTFDRLSYLWNDPNRDPGDRYPPELYPVFLRLMERFDISYRVVLDPASREPSDTSLIAQLVPDLRPDRLPAWGELPEGGDLQQVRVCKIVDENGESAKAEGLFYQLIVRLHKYSLGRANYADSVHWQRGLMLDDGYNGRALLEHDRTNVRITVRAAYPEFFISVLTAEVKWLVENFWKGLSCEVMVPCIEPCGKNKPGLGLFELEMLVEAKKEGRSEFPCAVPKCKKWQNIDDLLRSTTSPAPGLLQIPAEGLQEKLDSLRLQLAEQIGQQITREFADKEESDRRRFQISNQQDRAIASQIDEQFASLMQMLVDEAKEGPRLFSFQPLDPGFFDRPRWISEKFRLTLWCEHSRSPLPALNPEGDERGVYELDLPREWFAKVAPYLKVVTSTLGLLLPVVASAGKLALDDETYDKYKEETDFARESLKFTFKGGRAAIEGMARGDAPNWQGVSAIRAEGAMLRQLHALLKEKDPSFGGLVRVQNRRREFLWVHERFVGEY